MKTAGRENPNHGATVPHNRAHGAVGQNRFRSIRGAAKPEKFQPKEVCFFLTSPFIELLGHNPRIRVGISGLVCSKYAIENFVLVAQSQALNLPPLSSSVPNV